MYSEWLNISIFKGVSEERKHELKLVNKRFETFKPGEKIIRVGSKINEVCVILDGIVRCVEYGPGKKEIDSFYFTTGVTFPFYMLIGGEKFHSFDTFAVKKTKVMWLPWDEIEPIINKDIVLMHNILVFIAEFTCYNKMIARCLEYRRVQDKIAYWLLHLSKSSEAVFVPMTQDILSDILQVNRSNLNKELMNLQRLKVIEINKQEIKILDRDYLEYLLTYY